MSDVAALVLAAYRGAGWLARPALHLLLALRTRAGKEDPARRDERHGRAALARPSGALVWVHAASVGETLAVLPLIERIAAGGVAVLLTTGTVTSAAIAATRLPAGALHQFVPLDIAPWVGRFLDHWRPSLAICVESEIWPATILELDRRAIPQVLVNGRISERSARRWALLDGVPRALFGRLALVLAQTAADGDRLRGLGAGAVVVTGNLKFDGEPLAADAAELARLQNAVAGRPAWVAASTHPGEEEIAAAAHRALAATVPGLVTVLAPRHPLRGDEIRALLERAGLSVASRSRAETPGAATDVYLADTIGEMGLIYRLAPIAFLGGSLVPHGGQNPIEPARLGTAILHGPHTHNFRDVYRQLDADGGAHAVADIDGLVAALAAALGDPRVNAASVARARGFVDRSTGALERTLAALAPWVGPRPDEDRPRCVG